MFTLFRHVLQTSRLSELIENHMANQHSWRIFCSPLLLTSKQTSPLDHHIAGCMGTKQSKYSSCSPVHLICSCPANVATKSPGRKSHGKATFILILLFTTFAHANANVPTRSSYRSLHSKKTVESVLPFTCSSYLLMSCKGCDSVSWSKITCQSDINQDTFVHYFRSLQSKPRHSIVIS